MFRHVNISHTSMCKPIVSRAGVYVQSFVLFVVSYCRILCAFRLLPVINVHVVHCLVSGECRDTGDKSVNQSLSSLEELLFCVNFSLSY